MRNPLRDAATHLPGADAQDSVEKVPTIGIDEAGSIFIMTRDGAGASFFKGRWQPGIIFEGRDLMNFSPISDPQEVEDLLSQASGALAASLAEHTS